jgi:DNA-directed RNA polymerase subunit A'
MFAESIENVRFSIVSPDMIRRISVAKLIVPDTYNEDGYPIDGGLVDQRLGVIDPGLKCKTCGGRAKSCQGHFGHIELIRPVVHPEFSRLVFLLLQSTCDTCYRALVSEKQIEALKEVEEQTGLTKVKSIRKCPYCGAKQKKLKLERPTFFYMEGERLKADTIQDWLSKISDEDMRILGTDPSMVRPEWLILKVLLVPPVNARPSITLENGDRSEDDLTHKLVEIMRINQRLEQDIDAGAPQIIIDDLWELLQYHVTTYFNNETPGVPVARHRSTRPLKTLAHRLKGKEGRIRYNLSGKRVNFTARTVICGDPNLTINDVGISKTIAERLTTPFHVTHWNMEHAKGLILRTEYPMAINVINPDGVRKRVTETNREELISLLAPGWVIERQLVDGDIALFNRQPTLHKLSIMAHNIKVLPGRTMRMSANATTPYNADFDGDEMNLHIPQAIEAIAEARYLMRPMDVIMSPRDGSPTMFVDEDGILGAYILTRNESRYTKEEACALLSAASIFELPEPDANGMYTGKSIFSMLLPDDLDYEERDRKGNTVIIKRGELVEGYIKKESVGSGSGLLFRKIYSDYGHQALVDFMYRFTKISYFALYMNGLTIGIKNYLTDKSIESETTKIIKNVSDEVGKLLDQYKDKSLTVLPGYTRRETYELLAHSTTGNARQLGTHFIEKTMSFDNSAFLMPTLGARGSVLNLVQMLMFLGQQSVRGKRISRGYHGRVLPYFRRNERSPRSKGFVSSSFMNGLEPIEFYMHAMGARDSTMGKSLITAVSGYLMRRLVHALQDIYVETDLSVRNAAGEIIQPLYGSDGIDTSAELVR